jgi:hypothetical protein
LIGNTGGLDLCHHRFDIGSGNVNHKQLAQTRQRILSNQGIRLLPASVFLLGMLLDISDRQFLECALGSLGLFLRCRILAFSDSEHHPIGQLASIGEINRRCIADVIPARPTTK